jgi:hypothetical protein
VKEVVKEVATRRPGPEGPSALEREGGEGGGDVARSRWTLRARVDRRDEGGGAGEAKEVAKGPGGPSALEREGSEGAGDVARSIRTLRARVDRRDEGGADGVPAG